MNILRRAFTLVELLVVIAIFVLLLTIAVPAFSSMIYSTEQSTADNALRTSLAAARDAAARAPEGQDAAAVFFYDPVVGRFSIQTCISAGILKDADPANSTQTISREVFVPVTGYEPTQLPRGWMVRGYAPAGSIDDQWYGDDRPSGTTNLYQPNIARQRGNWLFPETAFYDDEVGDSGIYRQTFMVRFQGGTGLVTAGGTDPVLVFAPSDATNFRTGASPWNIQKYRADLEADPLRLVRRILAGPTSGAGSLTLTDRQKLLGDIASDTVLAKGVGQLALYNEKRLASYVGVRIGPGDCLYQFDPTSPANNLGAQYTATRAGAFTDSDLVRLNEWIQGADPAALPTDAPLDSDCRIYTIHRYLGTLQEISGTRGGQGVGA